MLSALECMRSLRHLCSALVLVTLLGVYTRCLASPAFDTLGAFDSLTTLNSGVSGSPSSAYFNPAGLAWPTARSHFGIIGVSQHLKLSFQAPPAQSRVPNDIYRAEFFDPEVESTPLPSQDVAPRGLDRSAEQQLFAHVGFTQALWPQHLYLGVVALIPLHRFELQTPSYPDERQHYFDNKLQFERWGAQLEGMSAAFALAWRVNDWFAVGGGASLSNHSIAQSEVFLSDASYRGLSLISPRVEVKSSLSPYASISAQYWGDYDQNRVNPDASDPTSTVSEPASSRWGVQGFLGVFAPEEVSVDGSSAVKIWGYPYPDGQDAILQSFNRSYRALPMRVKWGTRLDFDPRVADVDHRRATPQKSSSKSTETQRHTESSERSTSLDRWSWVSGGQWSRWSTHTNQVGESSGWIDQWELSSGVSRETSDFAWGADVRWRPTPVPHQSGRSSYVDPSQLAFSMGARWPITRHLSWQISAQGHWLIPREDRKNLRALDPVRDEFPIAVDEITGELIPSSAGLQTNNPGYPGYESQGVVWSGGVSLIWRSSDVND